MDVETLVTLEANELDNEQRAVLQDNITDLTDEQVEKFGLTAPEGTDGEGEKTDEEKEKEEAEKDPEPIEITTRTPKAKEEAPAAPAAPVVPVVAPVATGEDDDPMASTEAFNKAVDKAVGTKMAELEEKIGTLSDTTTIKQHRADVSEFVADHPEYSKYKKSILEHAQHPSYSDVSIQNIAFIVSAADQQGIGAKKERVADKKAKDTQTEKTPTGNKKVVPKKDPLKMSGPEFAKERAKVMGQDTA